MPSLLTRTLARVGDAILDPTVVFSFDRTGFNRHAANFDPADLEVDLNGRSYVVTGANGGIGMEVTRELAARGGRVWMFCRSIDRGEAARAALLDDGRIAATGGELRLVQCDVSDLDSVDAACARVAGTVHGLVHNAGALLNERRFSPQGIEVTLATHLVGPLRLTAGLLASLRAAASPECRPRIVWVSSGGMYPRKLSLARLERTDGPFDGVTVYADVKRAQVVTSRMLDARLDQVVSHAMHPGWAATAGVKSSIPKFYAVTRRILRTPSQGADTVVWLTASPAVSGQAGAFWFDRQSVSEYLVPGTRESETERSSLWERVHALAGIPLQMWG